MFLVAGSAGMLSRKPSPRRDIDDNRSHSPTDDDNSDDSDDNDSNSCTATTAISSTCRARINEALSSLGSSSVALHHQGITSLMPPPPTALHSVAVAPLHGCRSSQNARTRLMLIESMLSSSAASDLASTSAVRLEWYQEVLDIQKSGFVDEVTCDMCWSIILKEMAKGSVSGIVSVLTNCPPEEIRAFFDELLARRPSWKLYIQPELHYHTVPSSKGKERAPRSPLTEDNIRDDIFKKCYMMLTDIMCELRDDLDYDQALTILRIHSRCIPLAVLFHRPPRSRKHSLNFSLLLVLLAHLDYSPTFSTDQPRLDADFQWVVTTAVELLCKHPTEDLRRVIAHILHAIQPLAHSDPLEPEISQLRNIFPWVQPWSPRKYLARHPASPFLSFAIFLVDRSEIAARLLLEGGLVRTMEALYDQDFPDPRVRDDDPYVQTREELYKLCLRLLSTVSRQCDLRDCVLLEELKSDVRRSDRELSEQYFGVFWTD
ncbi:hypothetical protein BDY19DRAFT_947725 [Irpex rosettiformis]|uniref:Uncharacterized protein n=1 Tax=Irpex rosettiformis TaxID=378272 RepID=A0ACB8U303_9APHY|nr:hypothetical protein BDY19DRAFT_947725 [Irpex rosettiformis]